MRKFLRTLLNAYVKKQEKLKSYLVTQLFTIFNFTLNIENIIVRLNDITTNGKSPMLRIGWRDGEMMG